MEEAELGGTRQSRLLHHIHNTLALENACACRRASMSVSFKSQCSLLMSQISMPCWRAASASSSGLCVLTSARLILPISRR